MIKKDIKELKNSGVAIKISSNKIFNVSSTYESLLTNTANEISIKVKKKQLSKYL